MMNILDLRDKKQNIDISWGSIFKVILTLTIGYAVYLVRDVLLWVLFGLIISLLFNPAINFLQKFKISRGVATIVMYSLVLGLLSLLVYLIVPIFKVETEQLYNLFPVYFERFAPYLSSMGFDMFESMEAFNNALRGGITGAFSSILGSIASLFGSIFLIFTVFTIAIFFSLEEKEITKFILLVTPKKHEGMAMELWRKSQIKISGWFTVRFIGMLAVGSLTTLACYVLGIEYPVFFGLIAGIADIIPFVGPVFAGFIIGLFALLDSWQKAAVVIAIFIVIQQLENNVLIPVLTRKFMEFPAILVLVSILVGEQLWGLPGAILAIPLFGILYDFTRDILEKNKD